MTTGARIIPDFDTVVATYDRRLYNLMLRLTGDHHYAQDLTQDVLLIAYREYPKFRGESDVFTWLYRIAVNHHRRFLRRMKFKRWVGFSDLADPEQMAAADDPPLLEQDEQRAAVLAAIATLPPEFRETVALFYYEDQDCKRIAGVLGCSEGTVKSRLWRGRQLLAEKLKGFIRETEG
jgi:RNA polymerase sigma-70 factor, ECF subfamily